MKAKELITICKTVNQNKKNDPEQAAQLLNDIATLFQGLEPKEQARFIRNYLICKDHHDKMAGMWSVSTSPMLNPNCIARSRNPESICFHCFSIAQLGRFSNQEYKQALAHMILTTVELTPAAIPTIPDGKKFRFEAFGDLVNEMQFKNYLKIAAANPKVACALWTKNTGYVERVLKTESKPENLKLVQSSEKLNVICEKSPSFDKTFTVFESEDAATAAGYKVNCGARNCNGCGLCYLNDEIETVIELLK